MPISDRFSDIYQTGYNSCSLQCFTRSIVRLQSQYYPPGNKKLRWYTWTELDRWNCTAPVEFTHLQTQLMTVCFFYAVKTLHKFSISIMVVAN